KGKLASRCEGAKASARLDGQGVGAEVRHPGFQHADDIRDRCIGTLFVHPVDQVRRYSRNSRADCLANGPKGPGRIVQASQKLQALFVESLDTEADAIDPNVPERPSVI